MKDRSLLDLAREELNIAELLFNAKKYRYVCFFAQQVVEKVFKYYLLMTKKKYPFTHNIFELIQFCLEFDKSFKILLDQKIEYLGKYYTRSRYEVRFDVDKDEALKCLNDAKFVFDFVLKRIRKLEK